MITKSLWLGKLISPRSHPVPVVQLDDDFLAQIQAVASVRRESFDPIRDAEGSSVDLKNNSLHKTFAWAA